MNLSKAGRFLKTDIWRIREKDLPRSKSLLIRSLRILILTLRGLAEDRSQLRASALTFYSILAVVPALAMVFGIAKGFGFEKSLERILMEKLTGQEEAVTWILGFARTLLENVRGGLIAGVGVVFLILAIIMLLSHIENAFNDIWGLKKPRTLARKISDYLALMIIGPILFLAASAGTVFIAGGVRLAIEKVTLLMALSPLIFLGLKLLPFAVLWILFTFLYLFMPNTKINFSSAALAGVIAGTVYQIFQAAYISFQINVSQYNAVYGSFAALPLFFIWLQFSWLIVLFGAEISFAHQNVDTFEFEQDARNVSPAFKRLLALRIVHLAIEHFRQGRKDLTSSDIAHRLEMPIVLVNQIVFDLVEAGVLAEIMIDDNGPGAFQPARDPENITIKSVIDALERHGTDDIPVAPSETLNRLAECLAGFSEQIEKSPENKLLKEL